MSGPSSGGKRERQVIDLTEDPSGGRFGKTRINRWKDELDRAELFFDYERPDRGGFTDDEREEDPYDIEPDRDPYDWSEEKEALGRDDGGSASEADKEDHPMASDDGDRPGALEAEGAGEATQDHGASAVGDDDGGGFRFHGRNFGLTYSQVNDRVDTDFMIAALLKKADVEEVTVARELHQDGHQHFHVVGRFHKKKDIRNARFFDIKIKIIKGEEIKKETLHPNIKHLKDKKGVAQWTRYCLKDGCFKTSQKLDCSRPDNFRKRKDDFSAWKAYGERQLIPTYGATAPMKIFNRTFEPETSRKRNLWIWGPPEVGKTTEVMRALESWSWFMRRHVTEHRQAPYEGYNGEEIILSDDQDPKFITKEEICHMTNPAPKQEGKIVVYGDSRFTHYFKKPGVDVRFVILSNAPPSYSREPWFLSRFVVLNVVARHGEDESASWTLRVCACMGDECVCDE